MAQTEASWSGKSHTGEGKKDPVVNYVLEHSLREADTLKKLREATIELNKKAIMLGDTVQSQLFRVLLQQMKAKKVLEVGVYTGYNTLSFALSIPDDGKVIGCDITDEYVNAVGKQFFKEAGVEHKIDLRIQSANKSLDELIANGEEGTFDFAFVDADKISYDAYYEKCLVLVRKGGMIAVDNVIFSRRVLKDPADMSDDTLAIHTLNQKIHKDSRVDMAMLPFADGMILAVKL